MVEKMKTDVDKKLLVWKMDKKLNFTKSIETNFFIIKIESGLSTSIIPSTIPRILKTKFNVFWT